MAYRNFVKFTFELLVNIFNASFVQFLKLVDNLHGFSFAAQFSGSRVNSCTITVIVKDLSARFDCWIKWVHGTLMRKSEGHERIAGLLN